EATGCPSSSPARSRCSARASWPEPSAPATSSARCRSSTGSPRWRPSARSAGPRSSGFHLQTSRRCWSATPQCASTSRRCATPARRSTPDSRSPPTTSPSSWSSSGDDPPATFPLAVASVPTLGLGCACSSLEGTDLDKCQHPAFVSRVADEAGPRVNVYRSDSAQAAKLGGTSAEDADKKIEESLKPAISRFEAAERLRAHVYAAI